MSNDLFPGKKKTKRSGIVTPRTAQKTQIAAMPRMSREARQALRDAAPLSVGGADLVEGADRISRLPLEDAEKLVASIRTKGARLAVPGIIDLGELAAGAQGVARIVLESVQDMLLKLALQMAYDDYEDRRERQRQGIELAKAAGRYAGRTPDTVMHERIAALRAGGNSIAETAKLAGCSQSQVQRMCVLLRAQAGDKGELART